MPDNPVALREIAVYFTEQTGLAIADLYAEGHTLHKISTMPGMPSYGSLIRWFRERSEFRTMLDSARKVRALQFEEAIVGIAENAETFHKEEVPAMRLKFDALAWAAEKSDPEKYGKKTTISGGGTPVTFIVNTGVPDPTHDQLPPKLDAAGLIIETEGKEVVDESRSNSAIK